MERTIIITGFAFGARKSEQARQGGRSGGKDKTSGASGQPEHKYRHWWDSKFRDRWDGIRLHIPLLFSWVDKYYCMLYVFLHLPWFILRQL